MDGFQSLNITWQASSLLLGVSLPLCVCMWGLPVYVAFCKTTFLLSKMLRIKELCKYARAEPKLAISVWLSCFICCGSLLWSDVPQERPLVSYWSQSYLEQIEWQNPVSGNKVEKPILLLFYLSAYAMLPTPVISVVTLCSYTPWTALLGTFWFSSLHSDPVMLNTSSQYHLYSFCGSCEVSRGRLLGQRGTSLLVVHG